MSEDQRSNRVEAASDSLQDWLWKLDRIQEEMQQAISDVHFLFSLKVGSQTGSARESATFPYGTVVSHVATSCAKFQAPKTRDLWLDLGCKRLPFIVSWEEFSLTDTVPSTFCAEGEDRLPLRESLGWNTWHYLPKDSGQEVLTEGRRHEIMSRQCDLHTAALEACHSAPKAVLDRVGDLSVLGCWARALFYLSLKRLHPLLQSWGTIVHERPIEHDELCDPELTFSDLNDLLVFIEPGAISTATAYAFDAFRHLAEGRPTEGTDATVDEPPEPPAVVGVALLDAAMILNDADDTLAKEKKRAWQNSRNPKLPESIGYCKTHSQRKLYRLTDLCDFVESIEGDAICKKYRLRSALMNKARPPRPE